MKTEKREKTGMAQRVSVGMLLVMVLLAGTAFGEQKIRIAGSGGMIATMNELAKAYMAENKNVVFEINQKSIESTGGVQVAAAGQIDIGLSSRPLKDDEKAMVHATEISRVATVIGVHKNVTLKEITSEQLCKIYAGSIVSWKALGGNAENIVPLSRPDRDATKETVRKSSAGAVVPLQKDLERPGVPIPLVLDLGRDVEDPVCFPLGVRPGLDFLEVDPGDDEVRLSKWQSPAEGQRCGE